MTRALQIGYDGIPRDDEGKLPSWAKRRHDFIQGYCKRRGWDFVMLTFDQILEIRRQPEWIEAGKP